MINNFDTLITRAEDELRFLKTSMRRTAAQIPLKEKTVSVTIPLRLWGGGDYEMFAAGSQMAVLTAISSEELPYIGFVALSPKTTSLNDRTLYLYTHLINDNLVFTVSVRQGSADDRRRLRNGETIDVKLDVIVSCSVDFTLETSYKQEYFRPWIP